MTDRRTLFEFDLTRVARERDEARRALDDLRDRVEGFDVTRDELDAVLAARDDAIRERDEARAGCSTMGQWLDVVLIQRRDVRAERDRYREALDQITAAYITGASAGELADIAFKALEERTSP